MLIAINDGLSIEVDHPTIKAIRALFDRRNQIAHRKSKQTLLLKMKDQFEEYMDNRPDYPQDIKTCRAAIESYRDLILDKYPKLAIMVGEGIG